MQDDSDTFLRTRKFLQIKEGEPILKILWIISSPILYFNFKSSRQESSSLFTSADYLVPPSVIQFENIQGPKLFVLD